MTDLADRFDRWLWMVSDLARRWPSTALFVALWAVAMAVYLALGGQW